MRLARSAGVALGVLAVAVLLPGAALASARGARGKDPGPGSRDGGTGTIERFPCAPEGSEGSGIWGALGPHRHDNLVVTTQAGTLQPGTTFTVALQWEWRDWRPGAPLALRVCLDADGPDAVDGESTAPLDDLGVGPIDRSFVQPDTEPALQVLTDSGEVRPVVKVPVTITIPASAPAGGELCVRGAVTGAPGDHPTSPPLFDISRTLCRPIAQALPVSSPSPVATTPPAPPVPPPSPAPPAPSSASPAPRPSRRMKRVTPKAEIPTTGAPVGPELALAVLLLGGGVTLTKMRKRRNADADAGRSPGREG